MKDKTILFVDGRRHHIFDGRWPQVFLNGRRPYLKKMQDDLLFCKCKMTTIFWEMEFGLIGETVNLCYREKTLNVLVDTTSPTLNWACHISAKACSILAFISEQWNIQHVFQNTCNIKITNYCITYLASNIMYFA